MSLRNKLRARYHSLHITSPKLHKSLYPIIIFFRSLFIDAWMMPRQILQIDIIRFFVCFPKYIVYFILFKKYKISETLTDAVSRNTILHNMRGGGELSAPRSHLLIRPLITIDKVRRESTKLKVLSIGPRSEGEIYNLAAYGFSLKNIKGLDLFSYSSYIDVGDMHSLPYPNDSFDVVIFGWVLGYSDSKQICADEIKRVCKSGGVIAVGNGYYEMTDEEQIRKQGIKIGSDEKVQDLKYIEQLFSPVADLIYFRYDGSKDKVNGAPLILIYENLKP